MNSGSRCRISDMGLSGRRETTRWLSVSGAHRAKTLRACVRRSARNSFIRCRSAAPDAWFGHARQSMHG